MKDHLLHAPAQFVVAFSFFVVPVMAFLLLASVVR